MSSSLIIYVDTVSLDLAEGVIDAAAQRDICTAVIGPPESLSPADSAATRNIETDDFSCENLRRIVSQLERDFDVVGIHSSFGPFRPEAFVQESVATLAAERGLVHNPIPALYRGTNKYLAREALDAAGVNNIPFGLATNESELLEVCRSIGYPVILKPLTGVGSSLILKSNDDAQARENFRLALANLPAAYYGQLRMASHRFATADGKLTEFDPQRSMLVEKYIAGREASVECLVTGEEVFPLVVHDKVVMEETDKVFFEHLLVAPPARFTPAEVAKMRDYAVQVVKAMGLRNMFCHVELRYDESAGPMLLEINPRMGAGCVRDSIETFTGIDADDTEVALMLGEVDEPRISPLSDERHAMAFLFSPRAGVLKKFSGMQRVLELPEVLVVRIGYSKGDHVGGDCEEVFLASIWMEAADIDAAQQSYDRIREIVRIQVG